MPGPGYISYNESSTRYSAGGTLRSLAIPKQALSYRGFEVWPQNLCSCIWCGSLEDFLI